MNSDIKFGYDSNHLVLYSNFKDSLEIRAVNNQFSTSYSKRLDFKVTSLTCHPQRGEIAYAGADENIYIWHPKLGSSKPFKGGTSTVTALTYNHNGQLLLSGSQDGRVQIWDTETGNSVSEPLVGHNDAIEKILFSGDGQLLVTTSKSGDVVFWQMPNRIFLKRLHGLTKFTWLYNTDIFAYVDSMVKVIRIENLQNLFSNISEEVLKPLNNASFFEEATIQYDGLRFRSPPEIEIYKELKQRDVLVFPLAMAVLGGRNTRREPDFLVCHKGKWGILEVMGQTYHTRETAVKDHDRARLFKNYGLTCIEFYDATQCTHNSSKVVDDFISRLNNS